MLSRAPVNRGFFLIINQKIMDRFTKEIAVGNEMRVFEFSRLRNFNGVKFFVTSKDENNKPIAFSLRQHDAEWKLTPGSLRWLYDIESELSDSVIQTRLA
jgi:hypothetical protein